jgi:uncharacterized protein
MSAVFGDTYYFFGLLNRNDRSHQRCLAFARSYKGFIWTSEYVLTELLDGLALPPERKTAVEFVQFIRTDSRFRITSATSHLFETGIGFYASRPDKSWSLTDCVSFLIVNDEGITEALTADHHFEQAGFKALLK